MSLNKVCSECPVLDRAQGAAQPQGWLEMEKMLCMPHTGDGQGSAPQPGCCRVQWETPS